MGWEQVKVLEDRIDKLEKSVLNLEGKSTLIMGYLDGGLPRGATKLTKDFSIPTGVTSGYNMTPFGTIDSAGILLSIELLITYHFKNYRKSVKFDSNAKIKLNLGDNINFELGISGSGSFSSDNNDHTGTIKSSLEFVDDATTGYRTGMTFGYNVSEKTNYANPFVKLELYRNVISPLTYEFFNINGGASSDINSMSSIVRIGYVDVGGNEQ